MLQTNILKCTFDTKYRCVHEFSGGLPQTRINIFEVNYFKCWHNGKLYMNGQVNFIYYEDITYSSNADYPSAATIS